MNTLLEKFVRGEIARNKKIVDEFYATSGLKRLCSVKDNCEPDIPVDVIAAEIRLEQLTRISNFANFEGEVTNGMSDEQAINLALVHFIKSANDRDFDWSGMPKDEESARKLLENHWQESDFSKAFNLVLYYWYYFQRNKPESSSGVSGS